MDLHQTEQEIIHLLESDLEQAFALIYKLYARELLAVAYRYVGDYDTAKDILQETMSKAYLAINRFEYRGEGALKAWLRQILVRESLNHLKSFNVRKFIITDKEIDTAEEVTPDSSLDLVSGEVLNQLIAELPIGYRTVINLYALEGLSHKEIAKRLGIKERSSSSQYHRAKSELKRKIEQWIKENQ